MNGHVSTERLAFLRYMTSQRNFEKMLLTRNRKIRSGLSRRVYFTEIVSPNASAKTGKQKQTQLVRHIHHFKIQDNSFLSRPWQERQVHGSCQPSLRDIRAAFSALSC